VGDSSTKLSVHNTIRLTVSEAGFLREPKQSTFKNQQSAICFSSPQPPRGEMNFPWQSA
jgi:hypothetical protein